jgi:predicted HicB family RNase H-like nuclease
MGSIIGIENFCKEVEDMVKKQNEKSYMDAILAVCEKYGIEPESVAKSLTKPIKERIKAEAQKKNLLRSKSPNRLPL